MGHRENLLAGAKQCLLERGYAHTTARDLVAASGTNLASIGYHFGSKEALLNEAMILLLDEWATEMERILRAEPAADPAQQFELTWSRMLASFAEIRPVLVGSVEAFPQAERVPALREQLAQAHEKARMGLAAMFHAAQPTKDERAVRAVGSVHLTLLIGVLIQWLIDPARAPTASELAEGLRQVAATMHPASTMHPSERER
ncbi:TetR/AcrR family transcriptional regulator [Chondromyces crocatus]|uniref:TetR family transcriptional regulator n=1 Tax=Chondromyces crocatus TaxID=52 RepID=A0A0K1EJ61_CHOCO|nr:TetR/AcrR family transcriptional regulator [Chondromyces crocatus]AKT40707.1 TetR family transcriptional regulator [Chondromyces crocatus]